VSNEVIVAEGQPQITAGKRASIWDGSPLEGEPTRREPTITQADCARIDFREGIPWAMWAFRLCWEGPFRPWKKIHWRILWGLDIFLGPVPLVKTMIALNLLAWVVWR